MIFPALILVFPAYAGVIPCQDFRHVQLFGFSRIRGGDPKVQEFEKERGKFFPHTRG